MRIMCYKSSPVRKFSCLRITGQKVFLCVFAVRLWFDVFLSQWGKLPHFESSLCRKRIITKKNNKEPFKKKMSLKSVKRTGCTCSQHNLFNLRLYKKLWKGQVKWGWKYPSHCFDMVSHSVLLLMYKEMQNQFETLWIFWYIQIANSWKTGETGKQGLETQGTISEAEPGLHFERKYFPWHNMKLIEIISNRSKALQLTASSSLTF